MDDLDLLPWVTAAAGFVGGWLKGKVSVRKIVIKLTGPIKIGPVVICEDNGSSKTRLHVSPSTRRLS